MKTFVKSILTFFSIVVALLFFNTHGYALGKQSAIKGLKATDITHFTKYGTTFKFPNMDFWEMEDGLFTYSANADDIITEQEVYTVSVDIYFGGNYTVFDFWTNIGGIKIKQETVLSYMTSFIKELYSNEENAKAAVDWIQQNVGIDNNQMVRCITPSNTIIEFSKLPELDMYYLRCYTEKKNDIIEASELVSTSVLPDFSNSIVFQNPFIKMGKTNFLTLTDSLMYYMNHQSLDNDRYYKLEKANLLEISGELIDFDASFHEIEPEYNDALAYFFDTTLQNQQSGTLDQISQVYDLEYKYTKEYGEFRPHIIRKKVE